MQYLQYDRYFFISLFFLLLFFIFNFTKIPEEKKNKIYLVLFALTILIFILWSLFLSLAQYTIWKNGFLTKYLLPPYQKINYFLNYAYFHFWRDFIFRLIGVLIIVILMYLLNFIFSRDIFYDDEKILVPYFSLFFRFPYNALFLLIGFFVLFIIILIFHFTSLNSNRYSFRKYWLYLALILFILQPFILSNYEFLKYTP
jgi:heme A synthase